MRHKFILFTMLLLLLAACTTGGKQQAAPITTQIGTQGITLAFLTNAPPQRVFDEAPENLQFLVEVKNRGSYPLESIQGDPKILVQLGGFDPTIINLFQPPPHIAGCFLGNPLLCLLEGKTQFNPEGGFDVVEWQAEYIDIPGEVFRPNFQVTSCYEYQTAATPAVCVDPKPRNVIPERKACTIKDVALAGGQGAPVAVTKIEEDVLSDRVMFKIYVANVGGGEVISDDVSLGECLQSNLRFDAFNQVKVEAQIGGAATPGTQPQPLMCNPPVIRLTNNQGFTVCRAPFWFSPNTPAFSTPLDVKLHYHYKTSIQKQVEIRKTPT